MIDKATMHHGTDLNANVVFRIKLHQRVQYFIAILNVYDGE